MVYSDVYLAIAYFANVNVSQESKVSNSPKKQRYLILISEKPLSSEPLVGTLNFSEQASLVKTWDFVVVKNQKHAVRVNNKIDDFCGTCSNVVAEDAEGRRQMATGRCLSWCKRWDTQ